jgi:hypothetical protein
MDQGHTPVLLVACKPDANNPWAGGGLIFFPLRQPGLPRCVVQAQRVG